MSAALLLIMDSGTPVEYTSDAEGIITILDDDGTYTLEQISSLNGYEAFPGTLTFTISGRVISGDLSGTDGSFGDYCHKGPWSGTDDGNIYIKNRSYTIKIKKEDSSSHAPLAGAVFDIYKLVSTMGGGTRKDYYPMTGYTDLTTDSNGIAQTLTLPMTHGNIYFITEKQAPSGYDLADKDARFAITETGIVQLDKGSEASYGDRYIESISSIITAEGVREYTIVFPNTGDVYIAPTDYHVDLRPFILMLAIGVALVAMSLKDKRRGRKHREA